MFFSLSKIFVFFITPSNIIALMLLLAAVLLMLRRARIARVVVVVAVSIMLVLGYLPISSWLMLPLTDRFPAWKQDDKPVDGVIVLGGGIDADRSRLRGITELNEGGERVLTMLELARRYPDAMIVYSGGSGSLVMSKQPEAPIAGELLNRFGVRADRVILEAASRNTAENAAFVKRITNIQPGQRWLLVTSAFHMPRSVGAFRKVGVPVEAYPVDFRTGGWNNAYNPFVVLSSGLALTDLAVREWAGLVSYWLTGRTDRLLPGPNDDLSGSQASGGSPSR